MFSVTGVRALVVMLSMVGVAAGGASHPNEPRTLAGDPGVPRGYGVRPDGRVVRELAGPGVKAVVLFFVATDCPVSNRTFPEMRRVREAFAGRGVRVWYVYPNEGETAAAVREHQRAFDAGGEAVLDRDGVLTRLAGARMTPSVAVLVQGAPVYVGRVDDRYVRLGLERPAVQEHFAERVVGEVLRGGAVEKAVGTPVGCAIMRTGLVGR